MLPWPQSYAGITWSTWLVSVSILWSPFWFNPQTFQLDRCKDDFEAWLLWMRDVEDTDTKSTWCGGGSGLGLGGGVGEGGGIVTAGLPACGMRDVEAPWGRCRQQYLVGWGGGGHPAQRRPANRVHPPHPTPSPKPRS